MAHQYPAAEGRRMGVCVGGEDFEDGRSVSLSESYRDTERDKQIKGCSFMAFTEDSLSELAHIHFLVD